MATYSRREVHTTRVEFLVPAPWPGACWSEVDKAVSAAQQEMRAAGLIGETQSPADDAIRIRPGDDELIVSFVSDRRAFAERDGDPS